MAEYIDREEFIQHIEESDLPDMTKRAVIALVRHMPAADVVEVVHGEWEKKCDEYGIDRGWKCTHCKNSVYQMTYEPYEYCPHCGAKMDGGSNEKQKHLP